MKLQPCMQALVTSRLGWQLRRCLHDARLRFIPERLHSTLIQITVSVYMIPQKNLFWNDLSWNELIWVFIPDRHFRSGMNLNLASCKHRLKYLFWFYMWLVISASCGLDKSLKSFLDAAICPWEMHVLYNSDGIVKYSVIHHLWLTNSAQLCNKKFQSIWQTCWSCNATLFITYAHTCRPVVVIPVILEISSMSLNSEASRVSFLNQTLLQIEKYMKNGQPSFQCNV